MKSKRKYGTPYTFGLMILCGMMLASTLLIMVSLLPVVLFSCGMNPDPTSYFDFAALPSLLTTNPLAGRFAELGLNMTAAINSIPGIISILRSWSRAVLSPILSGDLTSAARTHARNLMINKTLGQLTEYLKLVVRKIPGMSVVFQPPSPIADCLKAQPWVKEISLDRVLLFVMALAIFYLVRGSDRFLSA